VGAPATEKTISRGSGTSLRTFQRRSINDEGSSAPLPEQRFTLRNVTVIPDLKPDKLMTVVEGPGRMPKVLRYDMKELVMRGGIKTMLGFGTILDHGWYASSGLLRCLCVMALIVCSSMLLTIAGVAGDMSQLESLNTAPLKLLMHHVNSMTVFVTAQYVVICLGRWWAIRTLALQKVYDAFTSLCAVLATALHGHRWHQVRIQVQKYGFASMELLFMAARDETDLSRLVAEGLLSSREADFLQGQPVPWQRPMTLWSWIMRMTSDSMQYQYTAVSARGVVTGQCLQAIKGINLVTKYLDSQLPFAYVHLVMLMVTVQNIVLSLKTGVDMASSLAHHNFWMVLPEAAGCMVVCFIYQSLLHLSCLVLDPFGDNALAFSMEAQEGYLAASMLAAYEAQEECLNVAADGCLWPKMDVEIESSSDEYSDSFGSEVGSLSSSGSMPVPG